MKISFDYSEAKLICVPGALVINCSGNSVLASVWYTYNPRPLRLQAPAREGDGVELHITESRLELRVNGAVFDEEWPAGEMLLDVRELDALDVKIGADDDKNAREPVVVGIFTDAENWKPGFGVNIGDCMPYCFEGRYHVLYLKDRHRHTSKWGKGAHQFAHISTEDFTTWQAHPMAVEIDDPNEGSICTGSHIFAEGRHYLYYAVRTADGTPSPLRRSVSDDGYHYVKDKAFGFVLGDKYSGCECRDPEVFCGADGLYHMLVTTRLISEQKGCLAQLISKDLEHWTEIGEMYVAPDSGCPECSNYLKLGNYYYLIFGLGGVGYYRYSRKPFEDWQDGGIVPCERVPKGAVIDGGIIFTGFDDGGSRAYAGTLVFVRAVQNENGTLSFERIHA